MGFESIWTQIVSAVLEHDKQLVPVRAHETQKQLDLLKTKLEDHYIKYDKQKIWDLTQKLVAGNYPNGGFNEDQKKLKKMLGIQNEI